MSIKPDHIDQLAAIIREVQGTRRMGAADLAKAILSHPGGMWLPPAVLAQPEGQSSLNVNLTVDTSPENLKQLCDGLAAAVTPNGGYEAATTDDPDPGAGGDQMVQVQWWIPQHGCDSLENTLHAIKYRIGRALMDWWATALVPAAPSAPEVGEGHDQEGEIAAILLDHSYVEPKLGLCRVLREADLGKAARAILARCSRTAGPPPAPVKGLVEKVAAGLLDVQHLADHRADARAAIREVAAWLDSEGYNRAADDLREWGW